MRAVIFFRKSLIVIISKGGKIMDAAIIASKLRTLRCESKESQQEVADAIGLKQSTYAMYESGQRIPSDENKIKLAKHFGKTVQVIFFD